MINFVGEGIGRRKVESCKDTQLICTLSDIQFLYRSLKFRCYLCGKKFCCSKYVKS